MIKDIFRKDINRAIEGVIKADNLSDDAVFQEVDEYVITNDLAIKLDEFFSIYSSTIGKPTESIGVWISGFFGSGKSHLLKILSYILANQRIHSDVIGELFLEKVDTDDFELRGNIQKALTIPAQTILFNIDQKAESSSKNRDDAILSVFMKVFNEMRGYYPKHGYIAKFESDLDKQGLFDKFKTKFEDLSGESWETGRETIFLESDNVAQVLSEIRNISIESASDIIDKYEENYSLSIEEFAEEVKDFIDNQDENYRLIFCVDEVGQYIGEDIKLMLNLQTIVETLATKCNGQAWVIVTSQSAVNELVANQKTTEFDFSKIMGRFKSKLNLTSANANEVIQKRLLDKNEKSQKDLSSMYGKVQNSLQSILHFTDRGRQYKTYKDAENFSLIYPFVPYQMDLFQSCIMGLSRNNAFQGKHQSIGERSMLDVVQNVTVKVSNESIGTLATFDKFFDGLSSTIRGELQTQINQAINNLGENSFEVKILKLLFMVKYVKEFNANIDNITTLLVNTLEIDITALKTKVTSSLSVLTEQVYIQKIGDIYEFLTDVEKDIENEIKSTEIEQREIVSELSKWIYEDIIRNNKVRFESNKQDYIFARKMDDIVVKGKDEELMLNIITPLTSDDYSSERLTHKSLADRDVILCLDSNFEFVKDLEMYVKTQKFIPQRQSGNLTDTERNLLFNKANDNNKRRDKLQDDLKELFTNAKIYFNGSILDIKSSEARLVVDKSFAHAIPVIYPNINMLSKVYSESEIKTILTQSDDLLTGSDDSLNEAENDIFNFLKRQKASHQNITIKRILDQYTQKPFGWYQSAVLCLIASMYMKKRVDLKQSSQPLNKSEILKALTNNREYENTVISVMEQIDDEKIKKAKKILCELFPDGNFSSSTPREITQIANTQYEQLISKLKNYTNLAYPFKESIINTIEDIKIYEKLDYDNFYDEIVVIQDDLLDTKEDFIDPILEFMEGDKRKIFDEIKNFVLNNTDNLFHIKDEKLNDLHGLLKDTKPYQSNKIQKAKESLKIVQDKLVPIIDKTKKDAIEKVTVIISKLQSDDNFEKVPTEKRNKIISPLLALQDSIQSSTNIDFINQRISDNSLESAYEHGIDSIMDLLPQEEIKVTRKPRTNLNSLKPKSKYSLESTSDVDEFINELKSKMLNEINNGHEIII